ncbi:MAG: glycosyltransferase family protein [Limisphaerales bacterium]
MPRILYIQYTNPAGYPPLQHSSRLLARAGWDVLFLGTSAPGTASLEMPPHPRITVRRRPAPPAGPQQKLHFASFTLWCLLTALRFRPFWLYASDPLSCPVALLLSHLPGIKVLYHEHDSPAAAADRFAFRHAVLPARRRLAHRATACVLPNAARALQFQKETATNRPIFAVWNCPSRDEAHAEPCDDPRPPVPRSPEPVLHYHGNISPDLVPLSVIAALALVPRLRLRVIGYTTAGHHAYPALLERTARAAGVWDRLDLTGPLPRDKALAAARTATIGLALTPLAAPGRNPNFASMAGASNKAFEYLACGLPLLVSNLADWRELFVGRGYAVAVDPDDHARIAGALRWLLDNPDHARRLGQRGRQIIHTEWNYETQFRPVLDLLGADSP